ncbi:MAG: hypothetical protein GY803_31615 [Chloroflexi bacterium]|nr:hypothetical protein [Chloroflexota bacterium]
MKHKRLLITLIVSLLLLLTTSVALAAQPPDKKVIESGETVKNDIALIGESLEVQEGATIDGDVALFGGNAHIAGTVTGDVVLFGGNLTAAETAVFEGDCALLGGNLTDNRAESDGNCHSVAVGPDFIPALPGIIGDLGIGNEWDVPPIDVHPRSAGRQFFDRMAGTIGQTLALALLAYGAASLLPNHLTQMESVVRRQPMASGVVGLITAVAVPSLIALLSLATGILIFVCIGILGVPIIFMLVVGLAAAMLLGWITMGDLVGRWLADKLNLKNQELRTTAVLGTAALTFVVGLFGAFPFMVGEELLSIIIGSIGLGAVTLTRFGARSYPLNADYTAKTEEPITEDPDKITAILETLPDEDATELKDN